MFLADRFYLNPCNTVHGSYGLLLWHFFIVLGSLRDHHSLLLSGAEQHEKTSKKERKKGKSCGFASINDERFCILVWILYFCISLIILCKHYREVNCHSDCPLTGCRIKPGSERLPNKLWKTMTGSVLLNIFPKVSTEKSA